MTFLDPGGACPLTPPALLAFFPASFLAGRLERLLWCAPVEPRFCQGKDVGWEEGYSSFESPPP